MNGLVFYDSFKTKYSDCTVVKRNGSYDRFDVDKIISGVNKSAQRSTSTNFKPMSDKDVDMFIEALDNEFNIFNIKDNDTIETRFIESRISSILNEKFGELGKVYDSYNNWKSKYADSFSRIQQEVNQMTLRGDRNNANTNSAYVATKRCLGWNITNKELYQMNFMTSQELKECRDGYIYIHDMVSRNDTFNCCLYRMMDVLKDGFEMGDMWYSEPGDLEVLFDVLLAVTKSAAAQQYGGFTIPRIDSLIAYYAEKSYDKYIHEYLQFAPESGLVTEIATKAADYAMYKVTRDLEQGFQGMEYDLNTIGSSRGDFPFITITFGLDTSRFGQLVTETILKVRMEGQGKSGFKKIVLFPKLVFLYDEELHGPGAPYFHLYYKALQCSAKAMYPDMLSLTGDGYVPSMYKKYKNVISPMG